MKIDKSIIKRMIILMFICLLYPYYKFVKNNSFIPFLDTLTIEGLVLLVMGLVTKLINSGAFSSISYVTQKSFFKYNKDYNTFVNESKENRKFNYSIYLGIYCIVLSLLLSYFS